MRADSETTSVPANDAQLIQAVRTALGRDERLRGEKINISSCSFVVSLHGLVADETRKRAFEEAVRALPGVDDVKNDLRVEIRTVLDDGVIG